MNFNGFYNPYINQMMYHPLQQHSMPMFQPTSFIQTGRCTQQQSHTLQHVNNSQASQSTNNSQNQNPNGNNNNNNVHSNKIPIYSNGSLLGVIDLNEPISNRKRGKEPRAKCNLQLKCDINTNNQMIFNQLFLSCYNCDIILFNKIMTQIGHIDLRCIQAFPQKEFIETLNETDKMLFNHLTSGCNRFGNNLLHAAIAGIPYKCDKKTKKTTRMNDKKQLKNMNYIVQQLQNKQLRINNETLNIGYTRFPTVNEVLIYAPDLIIDDGINMSYFKDDCHDYPMGILQCIFWEGWDFVPLAENEKTPLFKNWYKYIEKGAVIPPFSFISSSKLESVDIDNLTDSIYNVWFDGDFQVFLRIFDCNTSDNDKLSRKELKWIEEDYGFDENGYDYLRKSVMRRYKKMVKLFIKKTLNAIKKYRGIKEVNLRKRKRKRNLMDNDNNDNVLKDGIKKKKVRKTRKIQNVSSASEFNWKELAENNELKSLKVKELKIYLSLNGLKISGKKADLITRIKADLGIINN